MRLRTYLARERRALLGAGVLTLATVALNVAIPFMLRVLIDGFRAGDFPADRLAWWLAGFLGAALVSGGASYAMRALPLRLGHRLEYRLRRELFDHLTRLDQAFFRAWTTGDLLSRLSSDLSLVALAISQVLLQFSRAVAIFVMAFGVMLTISWPLALVLLGLFLTTSLTFARLVRRSKQRQELVQRTQAELNEYCRESFAGIRTIKSFATEDLRREQFADCNRRYAGANLRLAWLQSAIWPLFGFWFSFGVGLLLIAGGGLVIHGRLTIGELVQFNTYLLYMQWPMLSVAWAATLFQRGRAGWERLTALANAQPAISDGPGTDYSLTTFGGEIVFEEVTVRVGDQVLLDRLNLTIPAGTTLGLTGPSGSGKSLVAALLARLIDPTEGIIRVNGRDIRAYPLAVVRRHLGLAAQEPVLFSETLGRNLAFGLDDPPDERITWAAEVAHLQEDIAAWPAHYETLIGERGVTLSGGQRQRTALGRAIARHPNLLILDDILAAVDTETEAAILAKLRPVMTGRTTLIISHRISALSLAGRTLVLENGRLTADGDQAALLHESAYYRRLFELQRLTATLNDEAAS